MASSTVGVRQKLQHLGEAARAAKRLVETGILDLKDLRGTLRGAKLIQVYGPQATMTIQGGHRFPDLPAVVDERGSLTYGDVDEQSWALAHALRSLGVVEGAVVGVLCRDHRGLTSRWLPAASSAPAWC